MSVAAARKRILICEDSPTYAAALKRFLEHDREFEIVGVTATAREAIAALPRLEPDLLTMDIELPGDSGLEAIEQIMAARPTPILVISSHVGPTTDLAAAALGAGALEAVGKTDLDLGDPAGTAAAAFRRRVRVLSGARVIRHPRARLRPPARRPRTEARMAKVVGICASTGGPQALAAVLRGLPSSFPLPVLVVQHIATGFTEGLAKWLDAAVPLPVRLAVAGAQLAPGVWIAPEGAHLVLGRSGRLALDSKPDGGLHQPCADVLLRSLAESAGADAVAVVLTGMGRDGADGVKAVHAAGGFTIAQDEETSAVYGMPRAAAENGAELVLPLAEIAPHLAALTRPKVEKEES